MVVWYDFIAKRIIPHGNTLVHVGVLHFAEKGGLMYGKSRKAA